MAEISCLLSHFNAMCDNICVVCVKPAKGYICWALSKALYAKAITLYFRSGYFEKECDYNIILIRTRSDEYWRVFQCDTNPDKGATQHASSTKLNKPAQKLKKKMSETLFIQKNRSVFWPGNFLEDCLSQYGVGCASEDCLLHQ